MEPAVFLDRDNTLIANDGDLGEPDSVRLLDGVAAGLKALREAGYRLVVVTNQGGVARGRFTEEDVDAVHQRIALLVDAQANALGLIDRFYYCPYHPEATVAEYKRDHPWRKPHPGMILQAARDMGLDLSASWMIGDQERDVLAGRAAGCETILITRDAELAQRANPHNVVQNFTEAVQVILRHAKSSALISGNGQRGASNAPDALGADNANDSSAAAASPAAELRPNESMAAEFSGLRRAISDLAEELRSDRMRRADFTIVRMAAGLFQLLAFLLALLGLLQLANTDLFIKWMIGAALVQLVTLTLLVLDLKG